MTNPERNPNVILRVIAVALASVPLIVLALVSGQSAHAQTFKVLHAFTCGADGGYPSAGVTLRGGYLYGTTFDCGYGGGTIYEIPRSGDSWGELIPLVDFYSAAGPRTRLVFGPDGQGYGTTGYYRGTSTQVYKLIPPFTVCGSITCPSSWKADVIDIPDPFPCFGDLTFDQQGNIYGTTQLGGPREGTVYELTRSGSTWTDRTIYDFTGNKDGQNPEGGVIFGSNGDLFGTTYGGGADGVGTVFKLANVNGTWVETILYSFQNASDGWNPVAGLVSDGSGNLYGATSIGGSGSGGTIFEMVRSDNSYTFKVLYNLSGPPLNCGPWVALTLDAAGNLYGVTECDGAYQYGSVFKLTNTHNGWVYSSLHDFTDTYDGAWPISNVTIDTDGKLYGTSSQSYGEQYNYGVVWMIAP